jgi:hypothetical protein
MKIFINSLFLSLFVLLPIMLFFNLESYWMLIMLVLALIGIAIPFVRNTEISTITTKGILKGVNTVKVCGSVLLPSPGTSMLSELLNNGILVKNIESMILITSSLNHGYKYYNDKLKTYYL